MGNSESFQLQCKNANLENQAVYEQLKKHDDKISKLSPDDSFRVSLYQNWGIPEKPGKGRVSIHYDHCLQQRFHSYNKGHTYCSVLDSGPDEVYVDKNYFLDIKSESEQGATLFDWSSNIDYPGLLMVICQQTNVPVFLSVEPDEYSYQFLEAVDTLTTDSSDIPIDAMNKVTDAVTLSWHPSSDCGQRTRRGHFTFSIVLFNDGKIKILIANHEERHIDGQFWLQDRVTNTFLFNYLLGTADSSSSPKMRNQTGKTREYSRRHFSKDNIFLDDPSCGRVPIDFFEHREPSMDLSFEGDRLLELYSQDVLNARLLGQEHSVTVACMNQVSISIVTKGPDPVIIGIRVGANTSYRCREHVQPMSSHVDNAVNAMMMPYDVPHMQNVLSYRALDPPRNRDPAHFQNVMKKRPEAYSMPHGVMCDKYIFMAGRDCRSYDRTMTDKAGSPQYNFNPSVGNVNTTTFLFTFI